MTTATVFSRLKVRLVLSVAQSAFSLVCCSNETLVFSRVSFAALIVCDPSSRIIVTDVGQCDPSTGFCTHPTKPTGTECDDSNDDTTNDQCTLSIHSGDIRKLCKWAIH